MGLGRKIGFGAVVAIVAIHVPCLACELKHGSRTGVAEAGVRKPPKAPEVEKVRIVQRDAIFYVPMPSRRVILQ